MSKWFSVKQKGFDKIYNIFGFEFKKRSNTIFFNRFKDLYNNKWRMTSIVRNYQFFWANLDRYSTSQRICYLSELFYRLIGYFPNFKKPKSINEKLNWMKFNYYDPRLVNIVDKYKFKEYIRQVLGENYTIPLIGVYYDVNDIDFDSLPNKFVIKTNIGNGGIGCKLVENKAKLNIEKLKYDFSNLMQEWNSPYYQSYQPAFKTVKPCIIIEEYMPIREGEALEYKMFCYHGEMKYCLIECDYFGKKPARAIYTKDFKQLKFSIRKLPIKSLDKKPIHYDEMVVIAEKLAKDFPHVRVDFYVVNNKIYLSELTFTSGAGMSVFSPREWDYKIGEYLDLNKLNPEYVHILPEFEEGAKTFLRPEIYEAYTNKKERVLTY